MNGNYNGPKVANFLIRSLPTQTKGVMGHYGKTPPRFTVVVHDHQINLISFHRGNLFILVRYLNFVRDMAISYFLVYLGAPFCIFYLSHTSNII